MHVALLQQVAGEQTNKLLAMGEGSNLPLAGNYLPPSLAVNNGRRERDKLLTYLLSFPLSVRPFQSSLHGRSGHKCDVAYRRKEVEQQMLIVQESRVSPLLFRGRVGRGQKIFPDI